MLAEMPLSDYWGWIKRRKKNGFSFRNAEWLMQQLNANVLNASGRASRHFTAEDFSLHQHQAKIQAPACKQSVLNQILSEQSSLSFPPVA
ncbi:hypothetical protein [Vibrio natriegens]|uniref:hypothetical protein n=1 Tax=Vibrio natriegens TaxID=691 RepID=UPI000357E4A2|nr:hypothetical protein [Vibrio natriegens]ALR15270.1 hypothetical protein PN96_04485 [Vibrio natriegens NBRC 15636 = ATCC 14048 = DSM 759]EPM39296.1 hypothetical protein M272_16855 [Vibrio natriegens NBRC 15636 = ATCC 14048 = DSM 759]EPM40490.1 hypothetical protein M272_12690 [Vibrio natriegens NBRC 15636 = ATCC 14048 = DSM 759]MDX6027275.1 hypothetical protein [Vibrio natriegens NBRC 15636 = ATCC 14048 = DSM 759]UUI10601.1 hypothetical protein NP431_08910 [Vibrio natriegens]